MNNLKSYFFIIVTLSLSFGLNAQNWKKLLPPKNSSELKFSDYQKAFNDYWAPFDVINGFYYDQNGNKIKAAGWKQFKRWEWFWEQRVDPITGNFPQFDAIDMQFQYYNPPQELPSGLNTASWTSTGPVSSTGGYAGVGRLNCIAFHPSDNNTFWVGAASGGIWKTTNGGTSWTVLNNGTGVLAVSDIIVPSDYSSSNTLYIATGDKDHWDNRSIGVLKSTDGGVTWNVTGLSYTASQGKMVYCLLIDPSNNQNLLAATSNGVYKTTNGGTTWNTQLTPLIFIDIEYKPGDFNTLYGSTTDGDIYISTNGGTSWTRTLDVTNGYRIELAVSPNQPDWIYAVVANSESGLFGIYKSTNSGVSFSMIFDGTTKNLLGWDSSGGDVGGQGWYDLSLAVSNTQANTLLVGGVNTWRSTDGGLNWSIVNHWWGDGVPAVHADKHKLIFRANGDLFECNDGGIYFSTNNGTSWADKTNGMVISQMYKLGASQTVNNEVITGLQDNGTKLISSSSWSDVKGGDGMECLIDYTDVNIQYGTYVNGQIDRTTNHWIGPETDISANISGDNVGAWVTPYIIDPITPATLYAGYSDVWKTTNRGNSWTKISTMNFSGKIRAMAIAPSNSQVLYVSDPYTIWKTTNGGTNWTNISTGLPGSWITYIAVKNDDPNTIWVTLSTYSGSSVYQSIDGGSTWTNISAGLPSVPVNCIIQNKLITSQVDLYVGTDNGVYYKKGSLNWVAFNTGLPNVMVTELDIYYNNSTPVNSKLHAASYGRGLWATPIMEDIQPLSCNEIFISEYIEGSSNNKYIELYNPTCNTITLTGNYNLKIYYNGSTSATSNIALQGSIPAGGTFVLANNSATLYPTPNQTSGSLTFNGDDAVELVKGSTKLDVIGQIGFDPGTEWGSGLTSTADNTLVRKSTISGGDSNGADVFDPSIEWIGFATDVSSNLGVHSIDPNTCPLCCPILTSAPTNVSIQNSSCSNSCTISGGLISAPTGTPCPTGSNIFYSTDSGMTWSTIVPTYNQEGPTQTIITRCQCTTDPLVVSPESEAITTVPGECINPSSPVITIIDNDCPSSEGTIDAEGCIEGTILEWASNETGPWSSVTPVYTNTPKIVYARCRSINTNCVSETVSGETNPEICQSNATITNAGGPTIADPCTCAGNGRFDEEVVVHSVAGETWQVSSNTGYLTPITFVQFSVGTLLIENPSGSGQYTLVGVHMDDVGYSLSVTNGSTTLSISNECWYPDPTIIGLNDNYCENSPSITLTGNAQLGDGSGPAVAESQSFTIDGNSATVFDPATLGIGIHEVIYLFDAANDNPNDKHPGCIATDTLEVTVNTLPDLTVGSNSPVCVGQNLNLTASSTGVDQWAWTGPNSFTSVLQNPSILNVTSANSGKYFVTGTNTITGCSTLDSTVVVVNTNPTVTANSNSPVCEGENLNLISSGVGVDLWAWTGPNNFTATVQNPTINNATVSASGKYFVTGTNTSTGCFGIDSVEVIINQNPEPPIVEDINVCEGGSTLIEPESTIISGGGDCNATVDMVITGIVDGPLTGGIPKAVEFYVINDIPDLSLYGFGSANNGGGTNGQEFTFPVGSALAGTYLWVATESVAFNTYFGFNPTYVNTNAPNINGDDAIELFFNGTVIDVFGMINVDGTGQPWEYTDGWVYRKNNTGQDGNIFVLTNWTYSGIDALDGTTTNATANNPFPIGTYTCDLAIDPALFNFYSDQALSNLLAGPALSYDPGTTPNNSPQSVWVTQIDPSTGCESDGVEVVITINAMPTAEAGNNQFYCGLPTSVTISATSNYNGQWSTTGAGTIANPTSKTTNYNTNTADIGKTIVFTWSTNAPLGTCPNVTDSVGLTTVTITPEAEFSYSQDAFCPGSSNPTVTHITGVDGVYTYEVVSLGPDLDLNENTGEINIVNSDEGTYAVTNTVDGKGNLIITGVIDGPLSGGLPKAIELYALRDISDLSRYGIESANNGNGSNGAPEFTFPSQSVAAGTFIWIASEAFQFNYFFGLPPTFINAVAAINGDDAIVLYNDGQAIDVFGNVNQSGTGQPWEYMDGWAYRKNNTGLDGMVFNINNWTFSGINVLDGYTQNSDAMKPFPIGSFATNLLQGCNNSTHTEIVIIGDLFPPTIECPDDITVILNPGLCSAIVNWNEPIVSDNCNPNPIVEQINGLPSGSEFTLNGSPYLIKYKVNDGVYTTYCEFLITILGYPYPIVGQLACNDTVQVSLDKECEVRLNADMFLEGGPYQCYNDFQLYVNSPLYNGVDITNLPVSLASGVYTITVGDAANTLNTCNTVMVLKDKFPPEIICNCPVGGTQNGYSQECTLDGCYDPNYNYNLPAPTVIEYCDYALKLLSTEIIDGPTCGTQLLRKTWRATDIGGNSSECTQEYYFKGFDLANMTWPKNYDDLAVNNKMLECDATYPVDELGNPHPSFTGYPSGSGTCKLVEVFYNDVMYPLNCGTKILRNWIVVDDCKGEVYTHTQIIRSTDRKAPTFCQPEIFKVNTKAYSCDANVIVPPINCLEDNCCNDLKWWVGTSQNFQISGDLNGNGYVDNNEQWKLMNVPVGVYELRYYAKDCCDNVETKGVLFEVYDGIPPIATCEQFKTVSLSVYGEAKIAAVDFNSGSFDNCKPVYFKALRVNDNFEYDGGCENLNGDDNLNNNNPVFKNDIWYDDNVYFCCSDLAKEVMVGLRVYEVDPGVGPVDPRRYAFGGDLYGHFNDCWSIVTVECKIPPSLSCPTVEISCEESLNPNDNPKLWPQVAKLCDIVLTYTDVRDNSVCSGNITRTWTANSCNKSTQCKQTIKIKPSTPFDPCTIVFPTDKQVHCTKSLPEGGEPIWTEYPCNVVTAEIINEDTFNFVQGSCKKILREWAVIDWCVYKQNVGAEANIDAITSLRKLNCNYLVADGYYRYTQELRVVDFVPPTIQTEDQCIGFTDGCFAEGVKLHAFASDSCNTNEEYWWKYIVVDMDTWDTIQYSYNYLPKPLSGEKGWQTKDILDKTSIPTLELINPVAGGIYKVVWTVGDGCGNANSAEQIFTVVDRKAPTPILVNLATSTMVNCMVEVCAIAFDKGGCNGNCISSFDNCTPKSELYFTFGMVLPKLHVNPQEWENQYIKYGRYFYDPLSGLISTEEKYLYGEAYAWDPIRKTTCRVFGIDRFGNGPDLTQILEVYVWDKFAENEDCDDNNYDFAVVVLSLNTEGDDCPQVGSLVGGSVNNCISDSAINEVVVKFDSGIESKIALTNVGGKFNSGLKAGSYNLTASKQVSGIPGLTTLDLVIIQKHVLGLKPVKDYCKLASMDINGDGKITASDILSGRKLILGYTEPKLNYNFLSNSYISENINNPQFSLKDAYNIKLNVEKGTNYNNIDFSGVMTGDVNNSIGFVEGRNDNNVKLLIDELELINGESYEIPVYVSGISECEGMQFELSYEGFDVISINSDIMDISKLNYKLDKNGLRFSWSGNNVTRIDEKTPLFTILIEATSQSHLNNELKLNNETIKSEIYRDEEVSDLKLEFRNTVGSFALHQNIPNPFSDKAIIGFDLPVENTYTLSIYDLTGKIIKEINGYGNAGYNSVNVERKDIGGNGVFYYRLKSGDNTDTKKMILIQ